MIKAFFAFTVFLCFSCTRIAYPLRMDIGIVNLTTDTIKLRTYPALQYHGPDEYCNCPMQTDSAKNYEWIYPPMGINAEFMGRESHKTPSTAGEKSFGIYLMRPNSALKIQDIDSLVLMNDDRVDQLYDRSKFDTAAIASKHFPKPKSKKQKFIFQRYKKLIIIN